MIKALLLLCWMPLAFAHEGHNHAPAAAHAPHGGILKDGQHLMLELVAEGKNLKVFPLTHDLKPIPVADVQLAASAQVPRKGKPESVTFKAGGDAFEGSFDAKGAHRFTLQVTATWNGKKDKASFNVEAN
ncbi:MAG: hypothetical protein HUU37_04205 [Bdellovibrionales bacterium]|nr:hypothetical protein [Bdellovibrionales bacterium]